jgi:hypothetical protein
MLHYWPIRQFCNAIWGLNRRRWDTGVQLQNAVVTWIERSYHRRRIRPLTETVTCSCSKPVKHLAG